MWPLVVGGVLRDLQFGEAQCTNLLPMPICIEIEIKQLSMNNFGQGRSAG